MLKKQYGVGGVALAAGVVCLMVYLRALSCGFVNYDDPEYVINNLLIRNLDPQFLARVFSEPYEGWWMPLTWLSLAIDYRIWGLNPLGYHLTNIVLHAVNTGLVVLIADSVLKAVRGSTFDLRRPENTEHGTQNTERGWRCPAVLLTAGLLWGIHPLRVESVAWVTERKDVLFGLFVLGSLLTYLRYVEQRETGNRKPVLLLVSLVLFTCSLMSKSVVVVLPVMLLVMDWYPLQRFGRVRLSIIALEKVPYAGLSLIMVSVTFRFAGDASYLVNYEIFPLTERLLVSGNGVLQYFRYTLWPAGTLPYHIIPDPIPVIAYAVASVCAITICIVILLMARRFPWFVATLAFFLLPLLPVLGLTQVGDQGFAARFTYLSSVAPAIMIAGLCGVCWQEAARPFVRRLTGMVVAFALTGSAFMSYRLITIWDNSETMWTRVIAYSPSLSAHWRRAIHRSSTGDFPGAVADYTSAIALATPVWLPHIHNMYAHRGEALLASGRYEEAVSDLTTALRAYPHPLYFRLRSEALRAMGMDKAADADLVGAGDNDGPLGLYFDSLPIK